MLRPRVPDRTRSRLKAFYGSNRDYADHQSRHVASYFRRFTDVVIHTVPDLSVDILEIGAGSGDALRPLVEQRDSVRIVALDVLLFALANVTDRNQDRVVPALGDALALPFRHNTFDAVVCFEVIEHLPDVAGAVDEMLRVLRRPGYLVFGLPNHGSLWTPIEDAIHGRRRLAFRVDGRVGALRWWAHNVRLAVTKRCSATNAFLYREALLDGVTGGDGDVVYYSCPLDMIRYLRRCGARLVETLAHRRFGWPGWLLPSELQGASVLAWVVD